VVFYVYIFGTRCAVLGVNFEWLIISNYVFDNYGNIIYKDD